MARRSQAAAQVELPATTGDAPAEKAPTTTGGDAPDPDKQVDLRAALAAAPEGEGKKTRKSLQRFFFVVMQEGEIDLRHADTKEKALELADTLIAEGSDASDSAEEFTNSDNHMDRRFLAITGVVTPPKQAPLAKRILM